MQLGAFSISLSVKTWRRRGVLREVRLRDCWRQPDENWFILKNGDTVIGLFQGMFEHNMLTFNPGWAPERLEAGRVVHRRARTATPAEGAGRRPLPRSGRDDDRAGVLHGH